MTNNKSAPVIGILCVLFGTMMMSLMDTGFKLLAEHEFHPVQSLFCRGVVALLLLSIFTMPMGGIVKSTKTNKPWLHTVRALMVLAGLYCFIEAYTLLPLAYVALISYTIPIMTTVLSMIILREKVDFVQWMAVIIGLIGCYFIIDPQNTTHSWVGIAYALSGSFIFSCARVLTRYIGTSEKAMTMAIWICLISTLAVTPFLPIHWVMPTSLTHWGLFLWIGVTATVVEYFMSKGHCLAPASVLAPFHYTMAIWSTIFGYIMWEEIPSTNAFIGGAILIISGLTLLYNEGRKAKAMMSQPAISNPAIAE